jgi:small-conductance mechanosensitive channel
VQIAKYFIYIFSIFFCFQLLNITSLLLGGSAAILVGIGFGIQDVFKDFVAGFVLLFEAKLRVGDVVEITPTSKGSSKSQDTIVAKILKINLRTTEIQTREGNVLIIPNTRLTQEQVENWSHGSELTRFTIKVTVEYGSNTELIQRLLKQSALAHPKVNKTEPVIVRLADFAENGLDLELIFWADQNWDINNYKSEIRFEIDRLFREHKIKVPYPQRVMHVLHETKQSTQQ